MDVELLGICHRLSSFILLPIVSFCILEADNIVVSCGCCWMCSNVKKSMKTFYCDLFVQIFACNFFLCVSFNFDKFASDYICLKCRIMGFLVNAARMILTCNTKNIEGLFHKS